MVVEGRNSTCSDNSIDVHRKIQPYPGSCANNCRGYAPGCCVALHCIGFVNAEVL
jgi:hypothetical protein